jgi:glycosyltransferase involved in cell wall biosynthesis
MADNKLRLKVMIFVDWFYPGFKAGGPIQSCINLIEVFKEELEFYVVTGDRDLHDSAPYAGITPNVWTDYQSKAKVYYTSNQKNTLTSIRQLIYQVQPDVIYINGMFSWHFSILPFIAVHNKPVKTIIAPRGMLQHGALQFKKLKKSIFLYIFRSLGFYKKIFFHATDEQELKDIHQHIPENAGVIQASNFPKMNTYEWKMTSKEAGTLRLVFLSRISPKKNLIFILKCLSNVSDAHKISLTIAGEVEDEQYWIECCQLFKQLPKHISVHYHGPVNNYLLFDFYSDYHVFILPSFGENYGHAIAEALLFGKPVIISDHTPWKNLCDKKIGYDISLKDPDEYVHAIESFCGMSQSFYDEWSKAARQFAVSKQAAADDLKKKYRLLF